MITTQERIFRTKWSVHSYQQGIGLKEVYYVAFHHKPAP